MNWTTKRRSSAILSAAGIAISLSACASHGTTPASSEAKDLTSAASAAPPSVEAQTPSTSAAPVSAGELGHFAALVQSELKTQTGFSGVSIEPNTVNLFWRGTVPRSAKDRAAALTHGHVTFVSSRYSLRDLKAAQARVEHARDSLKSSGIVIVSISTPVDGSSLKLGLDSRPSDDALKRVANVAQTAVALTFVGELATT